MKRILPLLLAGALLAGLSSCDKAFLKRTSVKVVVSENVDVNINTPSGRDKYLAGVTEADLVNDYVRAFKDKLEKGKIDIVDENPDYVIVIDKIDITESLRTEYVDNDDFELSSMWLKVSYTLTQFREDIPEEVSIQIEEEEELVEDGKKDKDKNKGKKHWSKWDNDDKGSYTVDEFGGLEGVLESHGKDARKEFKKIFKSKQ